MKKYKVFGGAVSFPIGIVLGLSKEQSADRAHLLSPLGKSKTTFETTGQVTFIAGEELSVKGDLDGYLKQRLKAVGKASKSAKSTVDPKKTTPGDDEIDQWATDWENSADLKAKFKTADDYVAHQIDEMTE